MADPKPKWNAGEFLKSEPATLAEETVRELRLICDQSGFVEGIERACRFAQDTAAHDEQNATGKEVKAMLREGMKRIDALAHWLENVDTRTRVAVGNTDLDALGKQMRHLSGRLAVAEKESKSPKGRPSKSHGHALAAGVADVLRAYGITPTQTRQGEATPNDGPYVATLRALLGDPAISAPTRLDVEEEAVYLARAALGKRQGR